MLGNIKWFRNKMDGRNSNLRIGRESSKKWIFKTLAANVLHFFEDKYILRDKDNRRHDFLREGENIIGRNKQRLYVCNPSSVVTGLYNAKICVSFSFFFCPQMIIKIRTYGFRNRIVFFGLMPMFRPLSLRKSKNITATQLKENSKAEDYDMKRFHDGYQNLDLSKAWKAFNLN